MYRPSTSSYASKGFDFCLKSCLVSNASDFLPTSICVLHSNVWYLHINSLLEWRFYYFLMFRNTVNQFVHLNPLPAVKTFTWTGAERHAWRNRYWRSRGQIVYRRNHRNGARLLQRTLIIPKLNHLFIALPNPSIDTLKSLTKDFFQFIWGSKCDRIKRNVIMQGNIYGGLNMLNLEKFVMSLKCSWIRRIVSGEQAWIGIMNALYGNNIASCIEDFGDDFYTNMIKENKNHFWKDVFLSWQFVCQQQYKMENVDTELFKMPIWFNSFIKVNKKSVFIKNGTNKVLKSLAISSMQMVIY